MLAFSWNDPVPPARARSAEPSGSRASRASIRAGKGKHSAERQNDEESDRRSLRSQARANRREQSASLRAKRPRRSPRRKRLNSGSHACGISRLRRRSRRHSNKNEAHTVEVCASFLMRRDVSANVSTCRNIACSIAAPSDALRSPFQPTRSSGRLALSLNGISSVSDRQPNSLPMYFDASFSASSRYLLAA